MVCKCLLRRALGQLIQLDNVRQHCAAPIGERLRQLVSPALHGRLLAAESDVGDPLVPEPHEVLGQLTYRVVQIDIDARNTRLRAASVCSVEDERRLNSGGSSSADEVGRQRCRTCA
jgi:hypothetical protein